MRECIARAPDKRREADSGLSERAGLGQCRNETHRTRLPTAKGIERGLSGGGDGALSKQGGRGDRHMGTLRDHNKRPLKTRTAKPLTKKQIEQRLYAITNRGWMTNS